MSAIINSPQRKKKLETTTPQKIIKKTPQKMKQNHGIDISGKQKSIIHSEFLSNLQNSKDNWNKQNDDDENWCNSKRGTATVKIKNEKSASTKSAKGSYGVDPSKFYQISGNRRGRGEKHAEIGAKLILDHEKKCFMQDQKLRRAAFRDVTSMKTWPLQRMAFQDLDEIMHLHLYGKEKNGGIDRQEDKLSIISNKDNSANNTKSPSSFPQLNEENNHLCEFEEDSTGLSSSSIEEPKRCKETISLSPNTESGPLTENKENNVALPHSSTEDVHSMNKLQNACSIKPDISILSSPGRSTLRRAYRDMFLLERAIPPSNGCNTITDKNDNISKNNFLNNMITSTLAATCIRENNSSKNQDGKYLPALWCLEPRIFGVQKPGTSGYKYIVGNLGRIIDHYWRKCDSRARHMYELIREKTPCRLYFDLEYCKFANPGKSEEENEQIMKELIEELCQEVKSTYGIHIDRTNIVDLDSSTNKKFSRHLVIHMPNGDLFSDAEACGAFVKHFVGRLCNELVTSELQYKQPALAGNLFVRKTPNKNKDKSKVNLLVEGKDTNEPGVFDNDDKEIPQSITEKNVLSEEKSRIKFKIDDVNELSGESRNSAELMNSSDHTCFIDLGVYTRNRLFRVLGSTKIGKPASAALHISSSNEFEFPSGFSNEKFYVPDMEKTTPSNTQTDQDEKNQNDYPKNKDDAISKFKNALNWNDHAEAFAQTLIVPVNSSKLPLTLLPNLFEDENSFPYNRSATTNKLASKNGLIKKSKSCSWPSPFVSLDNFIMNVLAKRCGVQGSVRSVSMTCEINDLPTTITYHMKDNRWCERIGRFHKSNNIMWIVDFREMNYYQTCYDVECRACGFKGKLNNLPLDVEESVRDVLFELELAVMDEAQFLSSTTKNDQHTHDKSKQEKYSDSQDDFTVNASFEQALLALDLSSNKNENISEDVEDQVIVKTKQTEKDRSLDVSGDDWNALLSDALDQNPELFP